MLETGGIQNTYQIIREVGAGSGGTVFLAYHNRLQKNVVLKKMKTSAKKLLDTRAEVDILKNLHHPSLPQVFDFVEDTDEQGNEVIYTVMDFIPGKSLDDCLKDGQKFTPTQVAKYTKQLCEAVEYLHAQKPPILHGDIKPSNIMLTPEDNIVLIDFNISGFSDQQEFIAYTKCYASPEQAQAAMENRARRKAMGNGPVASAPTAQTVGAPDDDRTLIDEDRTIIDDDRTQIDDDKTQIDDDRTQIGEETETTQSPVPGQESPKFVKVALIDQRSDIYSIGASMYPLLVGQKPDADYTKQIPVSKTGIKVSEGLAYVIDKSMCLAPEKRFQTVSEMLRSLNSLAKKDRRYKRLFAREVIFCLIFVVLAGVSSVVAYLGYQQMGQEKAQTYYEQALELHQQKDYSGTLSYVLTEALEDEGLYDKGTLGNLYYLAADSCFELEEYEGAAQYYRKAIGCHPDNVEYYCNYAIALTRYNQVDEALAVIDLAEKKGVSGDQLSLMKGELAAVTGKMEEAVKEFESCILSTKDDYLKVRAFMMYSDVFQNAEGYIENEELVLQNVILLEDASKQVQESYLPMILERQVEANTLMATLSKDSEYSKTALAACEKIIAMGWGTFRTYMNQALIYSSLQEYEFSELVYQEVLEKFGENYQVYKRMAFLELEKQSAVETGSRSYLTFQDYYTKAMDLFQATGASMDSDMEMQLLEKSRNTLIETGWLH